MWVTTSLSVGSDRNREILLFVSIISVGLLDLSSNLILSMKLFILLSLCLQERGEP